MILQTFLRLLLAQSVWNSERMQNIGFLWAIVPFLKKIYSQKDELKSAIKRHLDFFNTHPYFMGIFAGIVFFWEKKNYELVARVKVSYGGPMAALGTHMFWSTLRPFAGILTILLVFLNGYNLLPPTVFMIFYNGVHLPLRYYFIRKSSQVGLDFFYILKKFEINKLMWYMQIVGVFIAIIAAVGYICNFIVDDTVMILLFIGTVLMTAFLHLCFKKISVLQIFYLVIVVSIILSVFKVV